jgi:hypothetical protein
MLVFFVLRPDSYLFDIVFEENLGKDLLLNIQIENFLMISEINTRLRTFQRCASVFRPLQLLELIAELEGMHLLVVDLPEDGVPLTAFVLFHLL